MTTPFQMIERMQMTDLLQALAAPESAAMTSTPDISITNILAMPDPLFTIGTEWLHASGPMADLLLLAAWQGVMIAAVTAIALALLRSARPVWRYATATTALVLLTALPVLTWTLSPTPPADIEAPPVPSAVTVAPIAPTLQQPDVWASSPAPARVRKAKRLHLR